MGPLHPLVAQIAADDNTRPALQKTWARLVGDDRAPLPLSCIGEVPLVMSERLHAELNTRLDQLCAWVQARVNDGEWANDPAWPGITTPDVMAADIAIVRDAGHPDGWSLRWVEFQAFHSLSVSVFGLHRAWQSLHPELGALEPYQLPDGESDWLEAVRRWASRSEGGALLEHEPHKQKTAFDLFATARVLNLALVDPSALREVGGVLQRRVDGAGTTRWIDIPHVLNRLILHEDGARGRTSRILSDARATWSGHPVWFDRIHKGMLTELPVAENERCTTVDRWRELKIPAEELVAKSTKSWGGAAVRMNVCAADLDAIPDPHDWIVQPRFSSYPVATARDGAPLYGEIRSVVALPAGKRPWVASRLSRLTRIPMGSASSWSGKPGEGMVPVYAPPAPAGLRHDA